jgi:mannan endo-1,4-beta-mannosidase
MGYSTTQMNQAFSDIAKTGATVVRTWFVNGPLTRGAGLMEPRSCRGFNEVTSPSGIYYQSWSGSKPTINMGATGLGNFDNVVAAAKANGLRLIVAL